MSRQRKGHNYERVEKQFTHEQLESFAPKSVFNNKWVILKNLGARGDAHCYDVCDKKAKKFGVLYVEIGDEGVTSVANMIEFSHKQFSAGNAHRFTTILDCGLINNHVFYMVLQNRPGPTLSALLAAAPAPLSPRTAAFIAIDLFSISELLMCSGYVLRNFDASQWKFDVKSRTFFLADPTDIVVISDKRYRPIAESHLETATNIDLHWSSDDLTYAPISYIVNGPGHRMSELDMVEMVLYVIYELTRGKLPWKNAQTPQKTLEMKTEFVNSLPDCIGKFDSHEQEWIDAALRNVLEYLKLAETAHDRLEKLPVRDGAWCPNGARAGALISAVRYREIHDDFHKIVLNGRPDWSMNWRDVKLDWEKTFEHTPETLKLLLKLEKREAALELAQEAERLRATRTHYTIMAEHTKAETALNAIAIQEYLDGIQVIDMKTAKKTEKPASKRGRKPGKQTETDDEIEEVPGKTEDDSKRGEITSSRTARRRKNQKRVQRNKEEEVDVQMKEEEEELEVIVKKEEPGSEDEEERLQKDEEQEEELVEKQETKDEDEEDWTVKVEEPDDY